MSDDLSFRLSIAPELELFRPEIEYVCDFNSCAYYLVYSKNAMRILHYDFAPNIL